MKDSTLYTIGTALGRARDHEAVVHVLVSGHWLEGVVRAVDGHGLVLASDTHEHSIIRIEDISAVRVLRAAPPVECLPEVEARPMPAPRG